MFRFVTSRALITFVDDVEFVEFIPGGVGAGAFGAVPFVFVPLLAPRTLLLIKNCQLTAIHESVSAWMKDMEDARSLNTLRLSCLAKCVIWPAPSLPPRADRGGLTFARLAVP